MKERAQGSAAAILNAWPVLGCGVGLRSQHYPVVTRDWPAMDFFEAISENYMDSGGRPLHILEDIRRHYPVALHGVSLSIGSCDELNPAYLTRLKALADRIEPEIVSDHLCWSGVKGYQLHDLLPLPFTEEAVAHVARRVDQVQNHLGRRILLENVSTYVTYKHSVMPEWEFLTEVARRSGCGILLDLNNIYVNAVNHKFDPMEYLRRIPGEMVGQFHLAGHTNMGDFLFDTHNDHVIDPVWDLYREALRRWGKISTLIEWDADIPGYEVLAAEADKARLLYVEAGDFRPENTEIKVSSSVRSAAPAAPRLREVQDWLKSRILTGREPNSAPLEEVLNPQGGVPGNERMEVYAGGYPARMRESLADVYEAVDSLLEPDELTALAADYARKFPSHEYNLAHAVDHFPEFLRGSDIAGKFPYLPDLARFEWQVSRAFHAFDTASLEPSELAAVPPDDWDLLRLVFQPSVSLFHAEWPVLALWENRKARRLASDQQVRPAPERVLIGRRGLQVRCERLDEVRYRFAGFLLSGKALGEVLELMLETETPASLQVGEWFSAWSRDGLISRFEKTR